MLKRYCGIAWRMLCVSAVAMSAAAAHGKAIPPIDDKTLVAWVRLANLEQQGSGALSIMSGDEFDSITFGERAEARWMAGSHVFSRTQSHQEQLAYARETAAPEEWMMMAIVYEGEKIRIYRNGQLYAAYETDSQVRYGRNTKILLGLRAAGSYGVHGYWNGVIEEARLYDVALTEEQIGSMEPDRISTVKPLGWWTFDEDVVRDKMGNFPDGQPAGNVRIADGALHLDGSGYVLISDERPPMYREVQAGFYTPPRVGQMWDTWLYFHEGIYYMYYICGQPWDAHEFATSPDGVHWTYQGVVVKPRPGTTWVGTGHIWKSPNFGQNGQWIMNYSEWVGDKQDIMFITSTDLRNWTKVDESKRFVQDTRWYEEKGRWDCIDVVQGDDGYLYGYFTADPKPTPGICGFGAARSANGVDWEAIPPVEGDMHGEFGGIQKIGDRYYITMSEGRIGIGESYKGPFWKQVKNHNVFNGDIYFPRFFHTAPNGPLMNHFYKDGPIFAAPLKDIEIDQEGTLRLVWWQGNDKLKDEAIPVSFEKGDEAVRMLKYEFDQGRTYVVEGDAQLNAETTGILFDRGDASGDCIVFEQERTHYGRMNRDGQSRQLTIEHTVNRDKDFGKRQHFRMVLHSDMAEVYINEYLTILKRVHNSGHIGFLCGGSDAAGITNVRVWASTSRRSSGQ